MAKIYENKINSLGAMVEEFKGEKMIILFGDSAPDTLKDYCYSINVIPASGEIKPGQKLAIGSNSYTITAVGDIAQRNLESLGHISVVFNGAAEAELPGSIYVTDNDVPDIASGDVICIEE